jgi:hypothetical protein
MEKMNTIKLSDTHLQVINTALEVYSRLRSGQIRMALSTAYIDKQHVEDIFVQEHRTEKLIRETYLPELGLTGGSYGFSHPKMGDARIGYEILKTFEEFLSVKRNDGYYGTGTNFYGPLKASAEPYPEVVGFNKYKDFILTQKQTDKIKKFRDKKEYDKMWDYIDSIKKARGEKMQIIEGLNKITLRVWRPQKIEKDK